MTSYGVQGKNMERAGTLLQLGVLTMPLVYPARDGEVVFAAFGGAVASIINWMIADGTVPGSWIDDDNWAQYDIMVLTGAPVKHPMEELLAKAAEFFAKYPKQELFNRGLRDGVTIAPVATLEDVLGFDHLEARNYWYDYELPGGRKVRIPGVFARPGRTPLHAPGPAPMDADPAPAARPAVGPLPGAKPGRLPFEGLKVADFSWIGVGHRLAGAKHGGAV